MLKRYLQIAYYLNWSKVEGAPASRRPKVKL